MRLKNITHHLQQIQVYIHPRDLDVNKRMKGALEKHNFENRFTVSVIFKCVKVNMPNSRSISSDLFSYLPVILAIKNPLFCRCISCVA